MEDNLLEYIIKKEVRKLHTVDCKAECDTYGIYPKCYFEIHKKCPKYNLYKTHT